MITKLKHVWLVGTFAGTLAAMTTAAPAEEGDASALIQQVIDAVPKAPFTAKGKLSSDRGQRLLQLSHKHVNGVDLSYLEVTSPADLDGTRFLLIDRVR